MSEAEKKKTKQSKVHSEVNKAIDKLVKKFSTNEVSEALNKWFYVHKRRNEFEANIKALEKKIKQLDDNPEEA